jgi:hypothetical protein
MQDHLFLPLYHHCDDTALTVADKFSSKVLKNILLVTIPFSLKVLLAADTNGALETTQALSVVAPVRIQ